jgi:hypothetical protein
MTDGTEHLPNDVAARLVLLLRRPAASIDPAVDPPAILGRQGLGVT